MNGGLFVMSRATVDARALSESFEAPPMMDMNPMQPCKEPVPYLLLADAS
jgi:hypothetical protein